MEGCCLMKYLKVPLNFARLDSYPRYEKFRCPAVANDYICCCYAMDVPKLILLSIVFNIGVHLF